MSCRRGGSQEVRMRKPKERRRGGGSRPGRGARGEVGGGEEGRERGRYGGQRVGGGVKAKARGRKVK